MVSPPLIHPMIRRKCPCFATASRPPPFDTVRRGGGVDDYWERQCAVVSRPSGSHKRSDRGV
uniref:Uncharacterized protein n=1 Tax=Oryza barthii TaxID=65489 RepID=A0A0D3HJJ6_9ORYZ